MSRHRPRVAVLYNAPTLPREHPNYPSEASVVDVARKVAEALKRHGFRPFALTARPPAQRLMNRLVKTHPDVVFNLIEGFGGHSAGEAHVTSLLEMMRIPYTGCPPEAQGLCRSKSRTKALLRGSGLPTANHWAFDLKDPIVIDPWPGAMFVKPDREDASLGIDQSSVVSSVEALIARIERLRASHPARVLVESYLPGSEYNVGVLALPTPESLPIAEILYSPSDGRWPILTHAAKWDLGSIEDVESRPQCPAEIDSDLAAHLERLAVSAFHACGCRDYARIDFRLDAQGSPMIIEVNPNPDLDPGAGLARAIAASGRNWSEVIAALTTQSLSRGPVDD